MNSINLDDSMMVHTPQGDVTARGWFRECDNTGKDTGNIVHFTEFVQVCFYSYGIYTRVYPCTIIDADNHELPAIDVLYFRP